MSYIIRVWDSQHTTGSYTDIAHSLIIDLNLDDNRSANDDPFEVVGRQAKAVISYTGSTAFLLSLNHYDIPVGSTYSQDDIFGSVIVYNKNFYKHLTQVIDSETDAAVFTGLISKEGITYDAGTGQIEIAIFDTLYIWITLAGSRDFYSANEYLEKYNLQQFLLSPLAVPAGADPSNALGNPLGQLTLDTSLITEQLVNDVLLPIPDGYKRAYKYDIPDEALELDYSAGSGTGWCLLGQYSCVFPRDDLFAIAVSFFTLFRSVGTSSGVYRYKVKAQRFHYFRDSFIQPMSFVEFNLGVSQTITTWNGLTNLLKSTKIIPSDIAYPTSQSVTVYYGTTGQYTLNTTRPVWQFATTYTVGNQHIRLNDPTFGFAIGDINIYPLRIYGDFTKSTKASSLYKALLTLWGFGLKANKDGGITGFQHLVRTLCGGTALTVTDADVISYSSKGTYANPDKYASALETFAYGEMLRDAKLDFYRDFYEAITATYTIILPRSYFDNNTLDPFMPVSIYGKTLYLNKWSEPLYDDTVKLECFGSF